MLAEFSKPGFVSKPLYQSRADGIIDLDEGSAPARFGQIVVTEPPEGPNLGTIIGLIDTGCDVAAFLGWFCLLWSRGGLGKPRHGAKLRSIGIAMLFGFANHRFCPAHVPELGDRDGIVCVGHPIIVRGSIDEGQTLFILRGSRFPVLP